MKISDLESAVKYLKSFTSYEDIILNKYDESKFDLKRFRGFLSACGVKYEALRAIHIAGSKGKGTTASLVAAYLERKGYKVGLFTSPYVMDITEGIKVNSEPIPEAKFLCYVNKLRRFIEGSGFGLGFGGRGGRCAGRRCTGRRSASGAAGQMITYFELLTTIMFQYFLDMKVDFAVLEVGLGGRLDSTNVCKPVVTVLTSVEKEHEKLLGRTYSAILREKLGIVKKGVPLIVSPQKSIVEREIRKKRLKGAVVWAPQGDPNFEGAKACLENLFSRRLIGKFDERLFLKLYHHLSIVGRFEVHKFGEGCGDGGRGGGRTAVFDIAHTIDSAKYLREKLRARFPDKKFVFLISMMKDKHVDGFLDKLVGGDMFGHFRTFEHKVIFTSSHPVRGYAGKELRRRFYKQASVKEGPIEAFQYALKNLKSDQVLVVTGSHFLVGEILRAVKRGSLI